MPSSSPTPVLLSPLLVLLLPFFSQVAALSSSEEWADFSDNFATDLAPLITLFGEQVTKQFLSESVSWLDNVIFALAPLGILTAVVSAIRLYGSASLKSFIGRAQEAHGVAEAELCSSTSEDVCEMWSNGGICRVFGRPKILEFMYTKSRSCYQDGFDVADGEPPHCGIYPVKEVLTGNTPDGSSDRWVETTTAPSRRFAPFPNLSLNVGTRRTSLEVLVTAVAAGLVLEASFFGYATWATFYNSGFYTEEDAPRLWSFVLGMAGTVCLMLGMGLCALLVEQRSGERRFRCLHKPDGVQPQIFWLQCGDQRVGDQQFRSFAYSEEKKEYMTSFPQYEMQLGVYGLNRSVVLWLAIVLSLLGFACQFVGFRGLHGSVTLYQLACTLVMSAVRALLRSRRLRRDQNRLESFSRDFDSDELDWQAMAIIGNDYPRRDAPEHSLPLPPSWRLVNSHLDMGILSSPSGTAARFGFLASHVRLWYARSPGIRSGLVGFQFAPNAHARRAYTDAQGDALCAKSAVGFIRNLEGELGPPQRRIVKPLAVTGDEATIPVFDTNPAARALNIRARLSHLTGDAFQPPGTQWDPELQATSRQLQRALQGAMGYIFDKVPLESGWERMGSLAWSAVCVYSLPFTDRVDEKPPSVAFPIHLLGWRKGQQWNVNEYQLAAVLGLWRQSMFVHGGIQRARAPRRKIIQVAGSRERTAATIRLWVAEDGNLEQKVMPPEEGRAASAVPFRLSSEFAGDKGWQQHVDEAASPDSQPLGPEMISLIALKTPATLLETLAQDIFVGFMFEAACIMEELTEVSVRPPLGLTDDTTTQVNTRIASSALRNPHIDALVRILYESGLATEDAALMCIVPALFHHSKLPPLDDSVDQWLSDARLLRGNQQYDKADSQLKRLLRVCAPQHHEKVVRALGELYRQAHKSTNSLLRRDFNFRQMWGIEHNTIPPGSTLSGPARVALHDYRQLAFLISTGRHESRGHRDFGTEPLQMAAVLELHKGLSWPGERSNDGPAPGRSRLTTLAVLEKYDMTSRNSAAYHELLFTAIALGNVEVLDDLRLLNPNLVLEFSAYDPAELPDSAETLTPYITARFNSEPLEGRGSIRPDGCGTVGFLAIAWAAAQLECERRVPGEAEGVLRRMLDWAPQDKMVDWTDADKNTPLIYAVRSGNAAAVNILVSYGADFHIANTEGETALSSAVTVGHFSIAEAIIKEGHDRATLFRGPGDCVHHALAVAFSSHKEPFIELLLRSGAQVDGLDAQDKSLLFTALEPFLPLAPGSPHYEHTRTQNDNERDPELVRLLLENWATPGELLPDLVQAAIDNEALEWIQQLKQRKHDVVGVLTQKRALTAALESTMPSQEIASVPDRRQRSDQLIRLLLELKVPVTPGGLQRAIRARWLDDILAEVLQKGGARYKDAVLEGYGTPLQTLLGSEFRHEPAAAQEKMLKLLIDAGCNVNLHSPAWKATPLQILCSRVEASDSLKLVTMLISAGADVNLTAADIPGDGQWMMRNTPLVLACVTGKVEVVKALLDAGAEVNTARGDFGSPLQAACAEFGQRANKDNIEVVEILLKAGADVNAVGGPGGTALALAAHCLLPEVVRTLLNSGADPDLPVGDETLLAYTDAHDAVEKPHGRLMEDLQTAFEKIQRGPFWDAAIADWDMEASSEQKREQIRELFASCAIGRESAAQPKGVKGVNGVDGS